MKKIKLLTSLGALSALGSGVALTATSCSSDGTTNGTSLFVTDYFENKIPVKYDNYAEITLCMLKKGQLDPEFRTLEVDYDKNKIDITRDEPDRNSNGLSPIEPIRPVEVKKWWQSLYISKKLDAKVKAGETTNITFTATDRTGNVAKQTITYTFAEHGYAIYQDYMGIWDAMFTPCPIGETSISFDYGSLSKLYVFDFWNRITDEETLSTFTWKFEDETEASAIFSEEPTFTYNTEDKCLDINFTPKDTATTGVHYLTLTGTSGDQTISIYYELLVLPKRS